MINYPCPSEYFYKYPGEGKRRCVCCKDIDKINNKLSDPILYKIPSVSGTDCSGNPIELTEEQKQAKLAKL